MDNARATTVDRRADTTMSDAGLLPLANRSILITGGTDGIGRASALRFAQLGARVIIVGRSHEKADATIAVVKAHMPNAAIEYWQYDLSLMRSVYDLAVQARAQGDKLGAVIHCAGVMRRARTLTSEGLETVFAVQYFARFCLNQLLLETLQPGSKIVNVSAGGTLPLRLDFDNLNAEKFYQGIYTLIHESVANDLAALRFMRVFPNMAIYNYGPFYVKSNLFADMPAWFNAMTATFGSLMATTPERAADDIVNLVTSARPSGMYSRNLGTVQPNRYRASTNVQDRLFEVSERMIAAALKTA